MIYVPVYVPVKIANLPNFSVKKCLKSYADVKSACPPLCASFTPYTWLAVLCPGQATPTRAGKLLTYPPPALLAVRHRSAIIG